MLLLCCSESGHSNVYLATAYSLLTQDPSLELHLASFGALAQTFTSALSRLKVQHDPVFHKVDGPPIFEVLDRHENPGDRMLEVAKMTPGIWNTPTAIRFFLLKMSISWTPEEYVSMFEQISSLITDITPDTVVVDGLFSPALSASQHVHSQSPDDFRLAVLSPNSLKDFTSHLEGGTTAWSKWPVHGAALTMPLTWWGTIQNWYFYKRIVHVLTKDTEEPQWQEDVKKLAGLPDLEVASMLSLVGGGAAHMDKVMLSSSTELEFPDLSDNCGPEEFRKKIVPCGPILRTAVPLKSSDPELAAWAAEGSVIYINLGTLCRVEEHEMLEMARALRVLLDQSSKKGLKVLWKVSKETKWGKKYETGEGSAVYRILGKEMDEDRVRIVEWIKGDPAALLDSGAVIASINHGGASSFYEAVL